MRKIRVWFPLCPFGLTLIYSPPEHVLLHRKIPKISPGAYIFQRLFLMGLSTDGNLRFKIHRASLIVGGKFTVFALLYFAFEGNFPSTSPSGGLYLEGRFNGGFFALPIWGAYT